VLLKDVPKGSRIFIDTNIFFFDITHHPTLWKPCKAFLDRVKAGELKGVVSPIVWNELFHQLMLGEVAKAKGIPPYRVAKLVKRHPQVLKGLKAYILVDTAQQIPNIQLVDVLATDWLVAFEISKKHQLLANDSLYVAVMQREGIDMLASDDRDFQRVSWLTLYQP